MSLRIWVRCRARCPSRLSDEQDDIKLALDALKLDPVDPDVDHPLVVLYQALHLAVMTGWPI